MKKTFLILCVTVWLFPSLLLGQENKTILASEAKQHVGERITVCGEVTSSRYLSNARSKPTFLDFGKAYPNEDFTVVIWPEDRAKFGEPENRFLHKNVCVTGEITLYRGSPQIVAKAADQIKEQ
jgi:DNA/RNA endonuclease YhcR with UshA esterase domain